MKTRIRLDEARETAVDFLCRHGMPPEHAGMVADHLVYAHLAGHDYAGLPRLQPMAAMLRERGTGGTIRTLRETDQSAFIDGAGVNGYVTSTLAMDKAIALAKKSGVGIVGVRDSWFSGLLRYYVERAAEADLVALHAANSTARIAPYGGIDRLLGTNPIAFAFPSDDGPLVVDFATATTMWGDVLLHQRRGLPLPEGLAIDAQGMPTVDPAAALAGAILAWGGARGSGVGMVVQALGILGGSDPIVAEDGVWGYFFLALDPALLMPVDAFKRNIGALCTRVEASRPVPGGPPVRVPGAATRHKVAQGRARGWIEVDEAILASLAAAAH
ncbi:Ldh family oxidoreductase [Pseudorhodoferax sp.]|uniref:Ldh family oxidoreductase n=1 Tax=Pseudorhodoferax sp. TaxID=1993553 RepID=UPI0039E2B4ED